MPREMIWLGGEVKGKYLLLFLVQPLDVHGCELLQFDWSVPLPAVERDTVTNPGETFQLFRYACW
jgi:hypothetical protein